MLSSALGLQEGAAGGSSIDRDSGYGKSLVLPPCSPFLIRLALSVASLLLSMPLILARAICEAGQTPRYTSSVAFALVAPATEANLYASYCMNQP